MTETTDIKALRIEAANIIGLLTSEGHQSFTLDKAADFFDDVFRLLEAERQRVDEFEQKFRNELGHRLIQEVKTEAIDEANSRAHKAEAELAALRGTQEPVAVLYASGDVLTRKECADDKVFAICCKVETPLFTHPPKPVVVRKIGQIDHDGGEYGEYFVELTDSAEIGRAVYVIEEGEAAGIVVKDGDCESSFREPSNSSTETFRENYKSSTKPLERCAAARDGECHHKDCPQLRDKEPAYSGRHCPIDTWGDE